jgi:hypothetical protein
MMPKVRADYATPHIDEGQTAAGIVCVVKLDDPVTRSSTDYLARDGPTKTAGNVIWHSVEWVHVPPAPMLLTTNPPVSVAGGSHRVA